MTGHRFVILAAVAATLLALTTCGQHSSRSLNNTLNLQAQHQQAQPPDDSANHGPLPGVFELDGVVDVGRAISAAGTITSLGWDAYVAGQYGTNGSSGLNVEQTGTALTLRAYEPGEYAWGLYGQAVGANPKPLKTLIDSTVCNFGGGRDDEVPLSYYVGIADYTIGAWRWFGPFGDVDVLVTVNSETLKSRFKSPSDNYYLAVLASNGSKASSALPAEGSTPFPIDATMRRVSQGTEDPGGLTIEEVVTWVEDNLLTEPAVVTGLQASADTSGVTLTWDTNIDPDVDIYQIFRADPDTTDAPQLLQGVIAPTVTYTDTAGTPGKTYRYLVRARNNAGYGGTEEVQSARWLIPPQASATDYQQASITVSWPAIEGAVGYTVYRADASDGVKANIADADAATLSYDDIEPALDETRWYWVEVHGEDYSVLGSPDTGIRQNMQPDSIMVFAPGNINVGDTFLVTVFACDLDYVLGYLNGVRILYPGNLSPDTSSWNLGDPGGFYTDKDGFWSGVTEDLLSPPTALFFATPGFVDVNVTPLGSPVTGVPAGTSGNLYNFKFTANVPGRCNLVFDHAYTYYWEPDCTEHYFTYEVGAEVIVGDPSNEPPLADLSAIPTSGDAPLTVDFDASGSSDPDGTIVDYKWDYDGDFVWDDDTGANPTAQYAYASEGYYYARVGVFDDAGAMSEACVKITVGAGNELPVADISADITSGIVPLTVNFDASLSYDPDGTIVRYEWDWDGDGTFDFDSGGVSSTQHEYINEGVYTATVRVTDNGGAMDEALVPITANKDAWQRQALDVGTYVNGAFVSLGIVNGTPAIAYQDGINGDLKYICSLDSGGIIWDTPITADNGGTNEVGWDCCLAEVNGYPAISYGDNTDSDLKYIRATSSDGKTWSTPVLIEGDMLYLSSSLSVVNGKPAIAYGEDLYGDLAYRRAADLYGDAWDPPVYVDNDVSWIIVDQTLLVVDGKPAISYSAFDVSELRYVRASDQDGSSWGSPIVLDTKTSFEIRDTSMAVVDGYPAISYVNQFLDQLMYIRANDLDGISWNAPQVLDEGGFFPSLVFAGGVPVIVYNDDVPSPALTLLEALDSTGQNWGTPVVVDSEGLAGQNRFTTLVDGTPAIAYAKSGTLTYAHYSP